MEERDFHTRQWASRRTGWSAAAHPFASSSSSASPARSPQCSRTACSPPSPGGMSCLSPRSFRSCSSPRSEAPSSTVSSARHSSRSPGCQRRRTCSSRRSPKSPPTIPRRARQSRLLSRATTRRIRRQCPPPPPTLSLSLFLTLSLTHSLRRPQAVS